MYIRDDSSGRFAYLQLYTMLKKDIVSGLYPFGSRLPSKRSIEQEGYFSMITIEHAYSLLVEEGYVEPREKSGYFVIYRSTDNILMGEDITSGQGPSSSYKKSEVSFPFTNYAKAARKVLTDYGNSLFIKSENNGSPILRRAISNYLAKAKNISVSPDRILIGSGSEYLYGLIVLMFGREHVYGIEDPCYHMIKDSYLSQGVELLELKLGKNGIHSKDLMDTRADILHVTPFHSYPSGITASISKRHEYVKWADESGHFMIEDDFSSEFSVATNSQDTLFSISGGKSILYLNTFSETIAPSIRIGYMVFPEDMDKAKIELVSRLSCTVPLFDQYILAELLNNGSFERHINKVRRYLRKRS